MLSADVRVIYPPVILIYMARIIVLRLISDFIVFIKRSLAEILVNIFQCANCALLGSPLLGSNVTMDQLSVPQPVFTITEKAPTRAISWLKAPTSAFTFKTLLRHYAKRALTPW